MSSSPGFRILAAAAAAFALCAGLAGPAAAQSIAVVVNGQPILTSEVQARAALLKLGGGRGAFNAQQDLIDERIKLGEARRYSIDASAAEIDQAFASIAQRTKLPVDQFVKAIGQRGVTAQTLKDRIRAEIAWGQLVRRKYAAQFASREREAVAALARSGAKIDNKATQYTLRQVVFVLPKGANDAQAKQRRAEAIAARGRFPGCANSVQFAASLRDVAVKDPVIRSSGTLGKEMNEMLDKMKIDGLTEPQRSEQGFEMIAVCERKQIADDSVLRAAGQDETMNKQAQEQAEKYLAQLKSRAVIEVRR